MRRHLDRNKLKVFMQRIAQASRSPGKVYLVGGSSMLLLDIREQTIDVDIKLDPEPQGVFEAIAALKNELDINVELASPDNFIPAPDNWRERSILIDTIKSVSFYHYDLYTQALAKLERGHDLDLRDVRDLMKRKLIQPGIIRETFLQIKPNLMRYPAIDAQEFERKVDNFLNTVKLDEK